MFPFLFFLLFFFSVIGKGLKILKSISASLLLILSLKNFIVGTKQRVPSKIIGIRVRQIPYMIKQKELIVRKILLNFFSFKCIPQTKKITAKYPKRFINKPSPFDFS